MRVQSVMRPVGQPLNPQDTLEIAAIELKRAKASSLPVCFDGRLVGLLTDRDIVIKGVAAGYDPGVNIVAEVMTAGAPSCGLSESLERVAELMESDDTHCVVVVNKDQIPVGIVSLDDLVAWNSDPGILGRALKSMASTTASDHDCTCDGRSDRPGSRRRGTEGILRHPHTEDSD